MLLDYHYLPIAFVGLLLTACSNTSQEGRGARYSFEFDISNTNSALFGRKQYHETGEIVSVTSLCRKEDIVYVVDPVHNNIKAIDLNTGTLKVSDRLMTEGETLNDITVHDGKILVSTDGDVIYSLTPSLSIVQTKSISGNFGNKRFLKNANHIYLYADPADVEQRRDRSVVVNALMIGEGLSLVADTLHLGLGYNAYQKVKDGYELINSGTCLRAPDFEFCIEEKYPSQEYFCKNISVGENSVSFFEFNNGKLRIVSFDVL